MKRATNQLHAESGPAAKRVEQSSSEKNTLKQNENESSNKDESMSQSAVKPEEKISCKTYFRYVKVEKKTHGVCLLCENANICKEVPMPNAGTTGLRKHLEKCHKKEFDTLPVSNAKKKSALETQKNLEKYLKVRPSFYYLILLKLKLLSDHLVKSFSRPISRFFRFS